MLLKQKSSGDTVYEECYKLKNTSNLRSEIMLMVIKPDLMDKVHHMALYTCNRKYMDFWECGMGYQYLHHYKNKDGYNS